MDWQRDRIGSALRGENPTVLARLPGAFAVLGDVQWLPGYCVLLSDDPDVPSLESLPLEHQTRFLTSMDILGQAVQAACSGLDPSFRRLNYDVLGNTDAFLHAHVWPPLLGELGMPLEPLTTGQSSSLTAYAGRPSRGASSIGRSYRVSINSRRYYLLEPRTHFARVVGGGREYESR